MTQEEILRGNKVLAEFDGRLRSKFTNIEFTEFLYDKDYNSLMSAWFKFMGLNYNIYKGYSFVQYSEFEKHIYYIKDALINNPNKLIAFQALVGAVEWYNGIKKD